MTFDAGTWWLITIIVTTVVPSLFYAQNKASLSKNIDPELLRRSQTSALAYRATDF